MRGRWGVALLWVVAAWGQGPARPLFDGKTLDGWIVDTPGLWQVRDGMIVGRHEGLPYSDFPRTRKRYRDFELRLRFRLVHGEGNTGV
jgi:hypothetical protein